MKVETSRYEALRERIDTVVDRIFGTYNPRKLADDKVIRDAVFGFNVLFKHEINLVDSPLIQRLRRIHQTALAFLTYPSATHTRFEHSIGCAVIADKMMRAINDRYAQGTPPISATQRAEVRLAALLHDCAHGPFSHASESVYGNTSYEVAGVKEEQKALFGRANPHEIMAYCIVTSKGFKAFWEKVVGLYDPRERLLCDLRQISLDRVASMILGRKADNYPQYLSQIVNGPFDADKFDYIIRDGYFTGLVTAIDIDRLFVSLDRASLHHHGYREYPEEILCMDVGGATVLEQVQFNKMVLFSSFYHHQKVRAAFRLLVHLLQRLREANLTLGDVRLDEAANFLLVDDYDVLSADLGPYPTAVRQIVTGLRNRNVPIRALVITKDALVNDASRAEYVMLRDSVDLRDRLAGRIEDMTNVRPVFVDCPEEPTFGVTGLHSLVKLAPDRFVPLDKLYPIAGWVTGYAEYRYRSYVFCPPGNETTVRDAAFAAFGEAGIELDRALCSALAKLPPA